MRAAIIALMLMFGSQAGADATKTWKVVSPSIVSVLPTWPGYTKPGFGAPVGAAPEGTGIAISKWLKESMTCLCHSLFQGLHSGFTRVEGPSTRITCARPLRKLKYPRRNSLERQRIRKRSLLTLTSDRRLG